MNDKDPISLGGYDRRQGDILRDGYEVDFQKKSEWLEEWSAYQARLKKEVESDQGLVPSKPNHEPTEGERASVVLTVRGENLRTFRAEHNMDEPIELKAA